MLCVSWRVKVRARSLSHSGQEEGEEGGLGGQRDPGKPEE